MILTLEVVGPQAANLGHAARKTFTAAGGTIGRANDNDWIIPDSYVSGTHARIHFRNNRFFVVDSSANGTSLKSRANRLTRGQWYALSDMDRLFLDTVEIRVRVDNPAEKVTAPIAVEPPATLITPAKPSPQSAAASIGQAEPSSHTTPLLMPTDAVLSALSGDRDSLSFERDFLNSPLPDEEALTKALERPPAASEDHYVSEHTTAMIPRDFLDDEPVVDTVYEAPRTLALNLVEKAPQRASTSASAAAAAPAPQKNSLAATGKHQQISVDAEYADIFNTVQPVAPVQRQHSPLSTSVSPASPPPAFTPAAMLDTQRVKSLLLSGLDAPAENVTPELTDTLTQILRECIQGLLQLQQQREAMKDEFRLSVTKFKSAENNPLRFSANVEDALYNLLVKRNPAYLAPADAVTNSFKDAQWHQTAMQSAINTAFFNMLQQFDPQRFASGDGKPPGLFGKLFGSGENAAWQQYNRQYAELRKQADGGFAALFGSAFAHAYQEQLDRLRQEG
jgi:type VI secretion system FHA domain protein